MTYKLPDMTFENAARTRGFAHIAGVDEVGRGPLAGPVVACAVILNPSCVPEGLNDSKALSPKRREALFDVISNVALVGIGEATVDEIDSLNILQASHLAMVRAINALPVVADYALVDGNILPRTVPCAAEAIIKGDARSLSIAAASIVAKVWRDRLMVGLSQQHPGYGWERNAGYPTRQHHAGLKCHGVTQHHRRSFAPIHRMLWQDKNLGR